MTIKDIHDINGTLTETNLMELTLNILDGKLNIILEKIDEYNDEGKNFIKLTEELINFMRNTLLYKEAPNYFKTRVQNTENYEKISKSVNINQIFSYIEVLNKYSFEMKNSSNSKLLFELAIIKIIAENNKNSGQKKEHSQEKTCNLEQNVKNAHKNEEKEIKNVENTKKLNIKEQQNKPIQEKTVDNKENEKKIVPSNETKNKLHQRLDEIKKIRIDNTLAKFNKTNLKAIIIKLEKLNDMLLNPEYSHTASIILDGTLKAASDTNLIFVYKTKRLSELFNENLIIIEQTIEKILNKKYNLIATDIDEWEIIKKEFNNKLRKFDYQEEKFKLDDIFKELNSSEKINKIFEDIIEYN